ncbi:MAG: hypothetical protein KC636_36850, partial [Myxococcales bacterium]|nr:hypothetical protein [Myxococcales bacterium]
MRRIEMYSSSRDLRRGLSRVLSLLAVDPDADERTPWWARLPDSLSDRARSGALCLEELCALLLAPEHFAAMDRVRERLGVAHLSQSELRGCCRRAVISGRAHADHMGRDIYGESNKALWDLVVAPL